MVRLAVELTFRSQLIIPQQRELYDYWIDISEGSIPARKDISPKDIAPILPNISLIEVDKNTGKFKVRLAGTALRDIYDREITGSYIDELDWEDQKRYWLASYSNVVENAKPSQGIIRAPRRSKEHLVQFWLRLPLSCDRQDINMILCHDSFVPINKAELISKSLKGINAIKEPQIV